MAGLQELSLLVVDDNAQMRTILGSVLRAVGIRKVEFAADGRDGIERLHAREIDVVYVDYEMPIMNGLQFIRAVRGSREALRFLPIIMLTGRAEYKHICAARDAGATEFLTKPVSARSILNRLNAVIMNPRPFVAAPDYFGPDRRRRQAGDYDGPLRRSSDAILTVEL